MRRFVKCFCRYSFNDLEELINTYAKTNNLTIISVAIKDSNGTLVVFEKNETEQTNGQDL